MGIVLFATRKVEKVIIGGIIKMPEVRKMDQNQNNYYGNGGMPNPYQPYYQQPQPEQPKKKKGGTIAMIVINSIFMLLCLFLIYFTWAARIDLINDIRDNESGEEALGLAIAIIAVLPVLLIIDIGIAIVPCVFIPLDFVKGFKSHDDKVRKWVLVGFGIAYCLVFVSCVLWFVSLYWI